MHVAVGANHSGYFLRAKVVEMLREAGHDVVDVGVCDSKPVDYPDIAVLVAGKVSRGEAERGILLGGTGMGMCIAANKLAGIGMDVDERTSLRFVVQFGPAEGSQSWPLLRQIVASATLFLLRLHESILPAEAGLGTVSSAQ
jgi:hypothetical protein